MPKRAHFCFVIFTLILLRQTLDRYNLSQRRAVYGATAAGMLSLILLQTWIISTH